MDEKTQKILRMRPAELRTRPKQRQFQEKSRRNPALSLEGSASGKVIPFKPRPETEPPEPAA
jgi:hypothetical protein